VSGIRYLIDSNIVIYYLEGVLTEKGRLFLNEVLETECQISAITKIEVMGWSFNDVAKNSLFRNFIDHSSILMLENEIIEKAIEIRSKIKIKTPDAIIASTAILNDFTLITRNSSDFKNILGLKTLNPFDL
jgi:predicted nucleic acid-binding protein